MENEHMKENWPHSHQGNANYSHSGHRVPTAKIRKTDHTTCC